MRPIFRICILVVVFALASIPPMLNVQAQSTQCFGLADADCKILKAADANIPKEVSFHHDSDFTFSITGLGAKQSISWKGTGLFALDPIPSDFSDLTIALSGLGLTADIKGSATSGSTTQKINTSYVIVDGIVYTKTLTSDGWNSQLLSDMLDQIQGSGTASDNPNMALLQGFISDPAVLQAVATIPNIKNLFKIQKTTNAPTIDGQKQIEFLYTYNIKTLITAKEMYPVIKALAKVGGVTTNFSNSQLAVVANLLAQSFNGSTLKIARWVGSKDSLYHALTVDFLMKFDPSEMGISSTTIKAFTVQIHFQVRLSQVGKPVSITAPENAAPPQASPTPTVKPSRTPKASPTPSKTRQPTKTRTPTSSSGNANAPTPTRTATPS